MEQTLDKNKKFREIDNEDQWQAWRIGRDCREENYSKDAAIARLKSVWTQAEMLHYFDAGFTGNPCPMLTASDPT